MPLLNYKNKIFQNFIKICKQKTDNLKARYKKLKYLGN